MLGDAIQPESCAGSRPATSIAVVDGTYFCLEVVYGE